MEVTKKKEKEEGGRKEGREENREGLGERMTSSELSRSSQARGNQIKGSAWLECVGAEENKSDQN